MPRPRSQPFSEHLTPEAEQMLALVQNRHDRHHLTGFLGHLCLRGVPLAAATAELVADSVQAAHPHRQG